MFTNSRKQVDAGTAHFGHGNYSDVPVYGHHGSLSKAQREEAESRFKSDSRAICVATMTLEIGIDIGDVDLVICLDPPFSLSSFLQRIGRGCRRLNGETRVLCVARDQASELIFHSLIDQASREMPAGPLPPFRRSVLVQQTLAYLRQAPGNRRTPAQFHNVLASEAPPPVTKQCVNEALEDMLATGLLNRTGTVYQPAEEGWNCIENSRIFSNIPPAPPEVSLIDVETGAVVANVAAIGDDGVRVAGRSYDVLPGGNPRRKNIRFGGEHADAPVYSPRSLPYAFDVGSSLARFLGIAPATILAVSAGNRWNYLTWLGKLMNSALAEGFRRRGLDVTAGPFHISVKAHEAQETVQSFRAAVRDIVLKNPLSGMRVEGMADLGPYLEHLTPALMAKSRDDFLDAEFFTKWSESLGEVTIVPLESELGQRLKVLSSLR